MNKIGTITMNALRLGEELRAYVDDVWIEMIEDIRMTILEMYMDGRGKEEIWSEIKLIRQEYREYIKDAKRDAIAMLRE